MLTSDYETLAPFYSALLRPRKHFEAQTTVLQQLCHRLNIDKTARVLDAACGTAEVCALMHKAGWLNISGLDGSAAMLAEARRQETPADLPLSLCNWEELTAYFASHDAPDLVYFLGHALPHAPLRLVRSILEAVFEGLNPGGYVLFDMRQWISAPDGGLVQAGRPPGVWRRLGTFTVEKQDYWVDERCSYTSGLQRIEYRIGNARRDDAKSHSDEEKHLCLYYTPFTIQAAFKWLSEAGFQRIESEQLPDWPYVMVFGQKP